MKISVINRSGELYLAIDNKKLLIDSARTVHPNFRESTVNIVCLSGQGNGASVVYEILLPSVEKVKKCTQWILDTTSAAIPINMERFLPLIKERKFFSRFHATIPFALSTLEDTKKFMLVASSIRRFDNSFQIDSNKKNFSVQISVNAPSEMLLISRINSVLSAFNQWIEGNVVRQKLSDNADSRIEIKEYENELIIYGTAPNSFEKRCLINASSRILLKRKEATWVNSKEAAGLIRGRTEQDLRNLQNTLHNHLREPSREGESSLSQADIDFKDQKEKALRCVETLLSSNTFRRNNELNRFLEEIPLPEEGEPS